MQLLCDSFFEALSKLADHDIWVSAILANAFTKDGVSLCKRLGMHAGAQHKVNGTMFAATMTEILAHRISTRYPGLRQKYSVASGVSI